MKKRITAVLLLLILTGGTGCGSRSLIRRREIDDLHLVQLVGIDKSEENPGNQMITVASKKLTDDTVQSNSQGDQNNTGGSGTVPGNKALIASAEGKTLFDACRNIQTHLDKTLFWSHTDYYLIGEEAARENIVKYIDFFARDHEFHIDGKVYIVKGSTAKELIEKFNASEFYIVDKMDSLVRTAEFLGISEEMKLSELMQFIDIHFGSARVPAIESVVRDQGEPVPDIESCGYAIVSDLKLADFIGRELSRGINLITNTLGSSIVTVKDLHGENASLEIIATNTEVIPHFVGDDLTEVTLKTEVESNLGEIQSQEKSIFEENLKHMEIQQSEILANEMERALEVVQERGSDCLGICDQIRLKHPVKWHGYEKQWIDILPQMKFKVEVESKLRRTYELLEPSGYRGWK